MAKSRRRARGRQAAAGAFRSSLNFASWIRRGAIKTSQPNGNFNKWQPVTEATEMFKKSALMLCVTLLVAGVSANVHAECKFSGRWRDSKRTT